jgi:hypothetical protein
MVRGPAPWAVILCRFNDVDVPSVPRSTFYEMVSEYGRTGLFDYWKDISYENISTAGSEVFGWYTMKYSFVKDSADPLHNPADKTPRRLVWINEAIRLAAADNVDLSPYYGLIVVINGPGDSSNIGLNMVMNVAGRWGQDNWRWCNKCQGIAYTGNVALGPCPAGGNHDHGGSSNYSLSLNDASFPGQDNWRWCNKCQGLAYAGSATPGKCPAGGNHVHAGSGDYRLGYGTVGYGGQNQWKWCKKCQGLAYAGGATQGPCPAGGLHDHTGSFDYTLTNFDYGINLTFVAHETGHGYGMEHSWSANPDTEYGDPWDIMSAMRVRGFSDAPFGGGGPRLNAPKLHKMGWLPDVRVATQYVGAPTQVVRLAALDRPEVSGVLMARVVAGDRVFTVEYRQPLGWDRGIGGDAVLIHELRSHYTAGHANWRWCNKCQSLFYPQWAACPAGNLHDHTGSFNYRLDFSPGAPGQPNWRWCRKCQQLTYAGQASPGPCAAGDVHDHTGSADYHLSMQPGGPGQPNWRWCRKCEALTYGGNATPGACPAGGSHSHAGSGNYTVRSDDGAPGQDNWRWCRKCQGMSYAGLAPCAAGGPHEWWQSGDYGVMYSLTNVTGGQAGWRWCPKCHQLVYTGNPSPGACSGGGTHTPTGIGYSVPQAASGMNGQTGWRWCSKCQTLAYGGPNASPGACAAGGVHDFSRSGQYVLANFGNDLSYLLGPDRHVHDTFDDAARKVHISIDAIDTAGGSATITLGQSAGLSPHAPAILHPFAGRAVEAPENK